MERKDKVNKYALLQRINRILKKDGKIMKRYHGRKYRSAIDDDSQKYRLIFDNYSRTYRQVFGDYYMFDLRDQRKIADSDYKEENFEQYAREIGALQPHEELVQGNIPSPSESKRHRKRRKDDFYAGKRYGKLIILEFDHKDEHYNDYWRCRCICGNYTVTRLDNVLNRKTLSCGCYQKERVSTRRRRRRKNTPVKNTEGSPLPHSIIQAREGATGASNVIAGTTL